MKSVLFKTINVFLAIFCVGVLYANHVDVNILSNESATSSLGDNSFEYENKENSFLFMKNGELVGCLPTNKKMHFSSYIPNLRCNAVAIGAKSIAVAGSTAAAGAVVGAAAPTAVLSAIGFGSSGVIAGSAAAAAQAAIGNVVAGSAFSWLTAAGFAAVSAPILVTGAVVGAAGLGLA